MLSLKSFFFDWPIPTPTYLDPRQTLKELIDVDLDRDALTKDDDRTRASFRLMYVNPPDVLLRDFMVTLNIDVIITVGRLRVMPTRRTVGEPYVYDGRYPVKIWTIDKKPVITGETLRQKTYAELERIFADNPSATFPYRTRWINEEDDNDYIIDGTRIYTSTLLISHRLYKE